MRDRTIWRSCHSWLLIVALVVVLVPGAARAVDQDTDNPSPS